MERAKTQKTTFGKRRWWTFTIAFFILLVSAIPFLGALQNDFVSFDDPFLCYENPLVRNFDFVRAFTTTVADDYLPLVTASFALENKLFGLNPFFFHLDNLLLHLANVALVFALLRALVPGGLWIAAVTALLFGIHPLHVESVAWVSQRKDMLSTFFSLWSLLLYQLSLKRSGRPWLFYALSVFCFLLALGSKFMAVSLPAVIALLAWYQGEEKKKAALKLVPFLGLMLAFTMIHLGLHKPSGANTSEDFNILVALGRGLDSLAFYFTKTVLPFKLGVFYERNVVVLSWVEYAVFAVWIAVIGMMFKYFVPQRRLMVFSLLLFLTSIFPVLQILPFGNGFAFGDRFMYFPSIGVFALFAVLVAELANSRYKYLKGVCGGLLVGMAVSFSYLSHIQALTWKNSETLWGNVLKHYPKSSVAHNNLGSAYVSTERTLEAQSAFVKSIELNPNYAEPRVNLGVLYLYGGLLEAARVELQKALTIDPAHSGAHYNMGVLADKENQFAKAAESYEKVLSLDATNTAAYVNLAASYYRLGQKEDAVVVLKRVLAIDSSVAEAHNNLGVMYLEMGRMDEAVEALQSAKIADPYYEEPRKTLSVVYAKQGRMDLAAQELQQALELSKQNKPKNKRRWSPSN